MLHFDKRALMGIGTLIIFIATILVAAVAAAVLISTSNVLQQRSLLVGQEARKGITDGIEVISIMTASDAIQETFNDFEILVRLSPGSDALQMRKFSLQYTAPTFDEAAVLAYADDETITQLGAIDDTSWVDVYDMDDDGRMDKVILLTDADGTNEALQFNLSKDGLTNNISLGVDLSNAGTNNVSIELDWAGIVAGEDFYGVVAVNGETTTNDEIDAAVNVTVRQFAPVGACSPDVLPPETYYCYKVVNGNDDYVLNSGERFKIYYRLKQEHELGVGQDFGFIFTTEKGRLSEARARTTDVVTSTRTKLWPLG